MKSSFNLILTILIVSIITICSPKAEIDIGYARQTGWSYNFFLENPKGWTLYLSKSLSQKMSVRFSFSRLDNSITFIGTMVGGLIPPEVELTWELIRSDLNVKTYEFSLYHALVEGNKMRLDLGGAVGVADFDLSSKGLTTRIVRGRNQDAVFVSYAVDVTVKEFIFSPLALRIGYQHRKMSTFNANLHAFAAFSEVSYSNIRVDILARFNAELLP